MTKIARLTYRETARFDRWRFEEFVLTVGEDPAEVLLGRMLEEIACHLTRAEAAARSGDIAALSESAGELGTVAGRIGLPLLARVSHSVTATAATGDAAARGATLARMIRLGEASLLSVWGPATRDG